MVGTINYTVSVRISPVHELQCTIHVHDDVDREELLLRS